MIATIIYTKFKDMSREPIDMPKNMSLDMMDIRRVNQPLLQNKVIRKVIPKMNRRALLYLEVVLSCLIHGYLANKWINDVKMKLCYKKLTAECHTRHKTSTAMYEIGCLGQQSIGTV